MKSTKAFLASGFLPVALVFAAANGPAGEASRYDGPTWSFLDTKKVLAAAAEITTEKYPDCDEATVEKKMVRVYRPDGTGEAQDESFTKVLTEKGKRNNRTLGLAFMLPYDTNEVVQIEVIKPGNEIVPVDVGANSKVTVDSSQMAMNIYDPNSKVLEVNIPGVEVGDVVHSITRDTVLRPIIPGQAAEENLFEGRGFIRHLTYEVHAPGERPLKRIVLRDEIKGTVKYSKQADAKNGTLHRWEVANVPRMFDEPSMPPYEMVLQRLVVSTIPDWRDVSKWYWGLSSPHLEATTPDMKTTVDELIANGKTDLDKTKALFYHVSKNIRYMGLTPEKDRPGFEPHDVKLTFDKKYGVCRDKAGLLVSMLRMAGLHAYPVLINVGARKDKEAPEPFFNHAIVSVELKKGEYVLMDPTDENTRELLPAHECNLSYLVCRPEGETILTSPVQPAEQNMMRVKTTATLTAAGNLVARSELAFDGINDNSYRSAFARMKPDDTRRFFERDLKRSLPGARLKSLKVTPENMLDVTQPIRAELEFTAEGVTAAGNGKAVVNLPWIGKDVGVINFILDGVGLEKRKYPLQTYVACGLKEDLTLKLDNGFTGAISMPNCSPVNDKSLTYSERCEFKNQSLDCSRELKLKVVEFSPTEYLKLKSTLKALEYDARKEPVLAISDRAATQPVANAELPAEKPVESAARVLESHKQLAVKDAHTATYHVKYSKQILTYNGKVREAEIKVDYNPSCQEAKLLRGVVISKAGERKEISKDEINVMDAGWNASARRYTGGKILVANLPGVEIGSTIEVEFEITSKGVPFLGGFESFQLPDELQQKSFQLTAPVGVKVQRRIGGDAGLVKEEVTSPEGAQAFQWRAQKVKALPAESQLPPEWLYMAGVSYFVGDETAYLKALHETLLDRSGKSKQAAAKARALVGKNAGKLEAVKALRDFVAKSIRSAGPSFTDLPLSELSAADTTLTEGYGHAADHAILLHAMLTAAGFHPEFVLGSGLPPIPAITNFTESFPLPESFPVPLVRVTLNGTTYYLNDTDQYSRLGSTAFDGRLGIVLATGNFDVIKAANGCQDKTETVYSLSLTDDGRTRLGVTRQYYGTQYNGKNRYFSELPPEERRRYFQQIVSGVAQGARPLGDLTTKFDTYPGTEEFNVEIDNYAVVDGKYLYFDLPFSPSLFPAGADRRTLPLFISHQSETTVRTEIELPPGFRHLLMAPQSEDLEVPCGGGKALVTSKDADGKHIITHTFEISPTIIDPKQYAALLKVESALGRKSSRVFLLEKGMIAAP
jgi:transglutaminase-like putative cysteine protease